MTAKKRPAISRPRDFASEFSYFDPVTFVLIRFLFSNNQYLVI